MMNVGQDFEWEWQVCNSIILCSNWLFWSAYPAQPTYYESGFLWQLSMAMTELEPEGGGGRELLLSQLSSVDFDKYVFLLLMSWSAEDIVQTRPNWGIRWNRVQSTCLPVSRLPSKCICEFSLWFKGNILRLIVWWKKNKSLLKLKLFQHFDKTG